MNKKKCDETWNLIVKEIGPIDLREGKHRDVYSPNTSNQCENKKSRATITKPASTWFVAASIFAASCLAGFTIDKIWRESSGNSLQNSENEWQQISEMEDRLEYRNKFPKSIELNHEFILRPIGQNEMSSTITMKAIWDFREARKLKANARFKMEGGEFVNGTIYRYGEYNYIWIEKSLILELVSQDKNEKDMLDILCTQPPE